MDEEFEKAVTELSAQLAGLATPEQIRTELDKFLNVYKVSMNAAKSGITKKYKKDLSTSVGTFVTGNAVAKNIADLQGTEMNVDIVGKIIYVEKRAINVKGIPKNIVSGILGDATGTVPFTIWSDEVEPAKGEVYTFRAAYTKKWNDKVQINIGIRGKVEATPDVKIDNITSSVPASGNAEAPAVKIGDITDTVRNVTVTGKVLSVEPRNITVKGEAKTVYGGLVADESGKIQYTAWNDFALKEGETYCIKNAYIRSWKGIPQLNMGDRCEVAKSAATVAVATATDTARTVAEIMKVGGGLDIAVTGLIVDLRTGSGLIERCPQCNRTVLNGECRTHGQVQPVMDLRLKTTVDDGTGAISIVIGRADTEKLTGITLEQAQKMAADLGDPATVENRMAALVLLKRITAKGNVMSDDFGPQLNARSIEPMPTDIEAEAEKLYNEVEASL